MLININDLTDEHDDVLRVAARKIAVEVARREAVQTARRRCDECWHEGGGHSPRCSSVTQATRCGCCESDDSERPVSGQMAAIEARS